MIGAGSSVFYCRYQGNEAFNGEINVANWFARLVKQFCKPQFDDFTSFQKTQTILVRQGGEQPIGSVGRMGMRHEDSLCIEEQLWQLVEAIALQSRCRRRIGGKLLSQLFPI